jgi:hypothetical protein
VLEIVHSQTVIPTFYKPENKTMQSNENKSASTSSVSPSPSGQGTLFFLLVFVGFVIGLITGFATKDVVIINLSRVIHQTIQKENDQFPGKHVSVSSGTTEAQLPAVNDLPPQDSTPADNEKDKEEKKEEKKESEKTPADSEPKPAVE